MQQKNKLDSSARGLSSTVETKAPSSSSSQQQLVAIGYGLYRGDTLVARSRIVRITIVQPLVGDLLALVCEERKLDPDQTRVFESEGDLLDFVKDHKAGEPKALEAVAVCQVGTKYWLWAPEGSVKSDGTPEKKSRLEVNQEHLCMNSTFRIPNAVLLGLCHWSHVLIRGGTNSTCF